MRSTLLTLAIGVVGALAGCDQNNCYNAFTHSLDIASPFCSTYIRSTVTMTLTGTEATPAPTFPPITTDAHLSSRCVLDTNSAGVQSTSLSLRLSSACSCINVVPLTVTVTAITAPPETCQSIPLTPFDGDNFYNNAFGAKLLLDCGHAEIGGTPVSAPAPRVDTTYMFRSCLDSCNPNAPGSNACLLVSYVHDPVAGTWTCNLLQKSAGLATNANADSAGVAIS